MTEMVTRATVYDIGLFALPDHSLHNHFALPNKLFEYIMAGLAICVSDLPEMKKIVDEYDVGVTFHGMEPEIIAAAVNGFDRQSVEQYRSQSLVAAHELCWETEGEMMVRAYNEVIDNSRL